MASFTLHYTIMVYGVFTHVCSQMAWKVRLRKLVNTTGVVVYVCCLWHAVANHVVSFVVVSGDTTVP